MSKAREVTHRVVDIEVPGASTLRLALARDGQAGEVLVISHGFGGGGEAFRRPDWCGLPITVPASILPELRQALAALDEG